MKLSDLLARAGWTQDALHRAAEQFESMGRLQARFDPLHSSAHQRLQVEPWASHHREVEAHARQMDAAFGGPAERMRRVEEMLALQEQQGIPRWMTDPRVAAQVQGRDSARISEMARQSPSYAEAVQVARSWGRLGVPGGLDAFRLGQETMAERLALAGPTMAELRAQWGAADFGSRFAGVSAFSEMLEHRGTIGHEEIAIARHLSAAGLPGGLDVAGAREFLDAAGLVPPLSRVGVAEAYLRTPRVRQVSRAERRRRLGRMKRGEAAPPHVVKAYRLIHVTERVLRRAIDDLMTMSYGDDWPEQRLPLCDCKPLLRKWEQEGGDVLDHADWAHYSRIMSHPEHHADVFGAGFEDVGDLIALVGKARTLRAAVGHVRTFTPQNLLDLRLVFTTLEEGLVDAMPSFEIMHPE